jgi:hypothetical protein
LSYLLGTTFRQLPSNERKCLDVIPVDMVTRGMTLIAAALVQRKHARLYQLATSAINPVNMARSIELTGLAHRKHYKTQQGFEHWIKVKFETIPVSKQRYERLSIPMQKAVVSRINKAATSLHMSKPPLAKTERDLVRAEKLIELYEPFPQRSRRRKRRSSISRRKPLTGGTTGLTSTYRPCAAGVTH